jgi:hypothetical protein
MFLEKEIIEIEDKLKGLISTSNFATEKAVDEIENIMTQKKISLNKALHTKEGKNAMFQLLLHKHWVGYHAETLRQLSAKNDHTINFENYTEKIETKVAYSEMNFLLNQFIEEITPYLEKMLHLQEN